MSHSMRMLFWTVLVTTVPLGGQEIHHSRPELPTLETRASEAGNIYEKVLLPEGDLKLGNLKDLSGSASVSAIAYVLGNHCELASDGRQIFTKYRVRVDELLSDDFEVKKKTQDAFGLQALTGRTYVERGKIIEVVMPGGRVSLSNGKIAQIDVVNAPHLLTGHTYLLYLDYSASVKGFVVLGLGKGVFEVQSDGNKLLSKAFTRTNKGLRFDTEPYGEDLTDARKLSEQHAR